MIVLSIKIKAENKTNVSKIFLKDDFIISKSNKDLQNLVQKACDESNFEEIDEVIVSTKFDW
jgi:hypothetical protein